MSEEEKKAIADLKEMIELARNLKEEEFYKLANIHNIQAVLTILNLIENQRKEIEGLKNKLDEEWKEWNDLESSSYEEEQKLQEEINKKDRIIGLMASELTTPIHNKEWVINHYEKKVEEE